MLWFNNITGRYLPMLPRKTVPEIRRFAKKSTYSGNILATIAENGKSSYKREKHLASLLPLWPSQIRNYTLEGTLYILTQLRQSLRVERNHGQQGNWQYDLNRHMALLAAYKAEMAFYNNSLARDIHLPEKSTKANYLPL
jgi:hypothetical protein